MPVPFVVTSVDALSVELLLIVSVAFVSTVSVGQYSTLTVPLSAGATVLGDETTDTELDELIMLSIRSVSLPVFLIVNVIIDGIPSVESAQTPVRVSPKSSEDVESVAMRVTGGAVLLEQLANTQPRSAMKRTGDRIMVAW
jgi:hypothetical protein